MPGGDLIVEWRDDDHVMLTGPAEFEFFGHVRSADRRLGTRARRRMRHVVARWPVETLTFGCRLNTYESEVMKAEALEGRACRAR